MRIRKIQAFNTLDLALRGAWLLLWVPGACIVVALVAILAYDLLFLALPLWFTVPVLGGLAWLGCAAVMRKISRGRQSSGTSTPRTD